VLISKTDKWADQKHVGLCILHQGLSVLLLPWQHHCVTTLSINCHRSSHDIIVSCYLIKFVFNVMLFIVFQGIAADDVDSLLEIFEKGL